ncbi:MAG: transcription antitermination factor NusB [Patescibacteria group bacterium]
MASRHLARSITMQTLYEWDFSGYPDDQIDLILNRIVAEFGPGFEDVAFVKTLISTIVEKHKEIDSIIEHAAPEWPLAQIAIIDRNVLRIGLAELLFGNYKEVPPKVAINESIELAKTFGGENSGKFVNGVLGTVYRELGEPGKDETSKRYNPEELENLPIERRAGVVVMSSPRGEAGGDSNIALVHDVFGYWTLPKGRLQPDESEEVGARRAVMLELGLETLELTKKICENQYVAHDPQTGPVRRQVVYYLGSTTQTELTLKASGGLVEANWFPMDEIKNLKMYDDIRVIFKSL